MYIWFQDMDLIEVLWKQDVDLGFTLVEPATAPTKKPSTSEKKSADEIEKLKTLEAINATNEKVRRYFLQFFFSLIFRAQNFICIHYISDDHKITRFYRFDYPIAATNEQLFITSAPLSAFTRVRKKHSLPRTQFKRSFLRVCQRAHWCLPVSPWVIIGDRKLRTCTCTLKNVSRRRAFSVLPLRNRRPIAFARIGSDILCHASNEKDFQICLPGIYGQYFRTLLLDSLLTIINNQFGDWIREKRISVGICLDKRIS